MYLGTKGEGQNKQSRFIVTIIISLLVLLLPFVFTNRAKSDSSVVTADFSKKLDLQMEYVTRDNKVIMNHFRIFNRSANDVSMKDLNLSIKAWVYESGLRTAVISGSAGMIYDANNVNTGSMCVNAAGCHNFYAAPEISDGPNHRSNQECEIPLQFATGVDIIPAGGRVEGFAIIFSSDAVCNTIRSDWDNFSDDYSSLQNEKGGGGYFDDRHFALYSNEVLVGETSASGNIDPETGNPPGNYPILTANYPNT